MSKFRRFARGATPFGVWAVVGSAVLFSLPANAEADGRSAPAAPAQPCSGNSLITKKLPGGTTWRMCWRHSPTAGLILSDVTYQPRHESKPIEVLGSARLGQINVPYDDGSNEYNDVTDVRLGEGALPIKAADCPGGTVRSFRVDGAAVKGLCVTTQPRGFAYHGDSGYVGETRPRTDSAQGQDLVVYTLHAVGWYDYITQWNFSDDGTITAKEGATGNLSGGDFDASDSTGWPVGRNGAAKALSHQHSVLWRLDFKPGGSWKSKVEQYDTRTNGTSSEGHGRLRTSRRQMTKEFAGDNANDRWWRVVASASRNADGHPRSWEIVHNRSDKYTRHAYTRHDVYVSQYKACEEYASDNRRLNPDCRGSVDKYLNGENLTRPVVWVNVGFHHIARDEDQTPMPVHWQGFQIVPRDVTDMSPLTPDRLHKPEFNGEN